jgi:hypothetical protein
VIDESTGVPVKLVSAFTNVNDKIYFTGVAKNGNSLVYRLYSRESGNVL